MLTAAVVLAIAAILLATASLIVAHTWRVLGEDLAARLDRLERLERARPSALVVTGPPRSGV